MPDVGAGPENRRGGRSLPPVLATNSRSRRSASSISPFFSRAAALLVHGGICSIRYVSADKRIGTDHVEHWGRIVWRRPQEIARRLLHVGNLEFLCKRGQGTGD